MIYRLFIAAELPQPIKTVLAVAQERFGGADAALKLAAPASMHLTLRFLGDTSSDWIPRIEQALRAALIGRPSIVLELTRISAFPNLQRPSVVWAGVGGATTELARAQAALEDQLAAIGIARDPRPFQAHLTLGRVRRDANARTLEQLRATLRAAPALPRSSWPIERIVLFRSELRREGSLYTEMADCRLQIAE